MRHDWRHPFGARNVTFVLLLAAGCAAAPPTGLDPAAGPDAGAVEQVAAVHHEISLTLHPVQHRIEVKDRITLSREALKSRPDEIRFSLHAGLEPTSNTEGVRLEPRELGPPPNIHGINRTQEGPGMKVPLQHFAALLPDGTNSFELQYAGVIHHVAKQSGEEHARSFSDTPGLIDSEGVYLAGQTVWLPWLGNELITFTVEASLPPTWELVSQGRRTRRHRTSNRTQVTWEALEPQDEAYLVAAEFTEYRRMADNLEVFAFLREPDAELADKYLTTAHQYAKMYSDLIGPYPYGKFALVENFWETGFGMPSFTLLGSKILRMPFILHSSYPHEILHNWWGNSVYVDYNSGNWCEGLTAYLADHLIKEQRGKGVEYRRQALQRYTDYVATTKDFPLRDFRSRHNSVTQAVGYDKMLMVFHMLRIELGDERFRTGLQRLYRNHRFERASFDDLAGAFSGWEDFDAAAFFAQWVDRPGAPELRLVDAQVEEKDGRHSLTITLEQVQAEPAFRITVPVAVTIDQQEQAWVQKILLDDRRVTHVIELPGKPTRVDVDPMHDLFRRLDTAEVPPALSGAFGAERQLYLLPSQATPQLQSAYRALAEQWSNKKSGAADIELDSDLEELPHDRAVWVLGWENRFHDVVTDEIARLGARTDASGVRFGSTVMARKTQSVVIATRHPADPSQVVAWIATDNAAALPGLARKLPHYGKYGYLGFEGDEPVNVAKGMWPTFGSPLIATFGATPKGKKISRATLAKRAPLASLPDLYDADRMMNDIRYLAANDRRGRGFGSEELDTVADWLAQQFSAAGLAPAGDGNVSFLQSFPSRGGDPERDVLLHNVVGVISGSDPSLATQSVVLGAHYDHLGLGWPDVRKGNAGKVHPGADDNASGVAVMLELARQLARSAKPKRSIVFVAFTGEEAGLRGSRYYVEAVQRFPAKQAIGMINLDTVGRLGSNKLIVFGTGTAREWIHIFFGAGYVTGTETQLVADDIGGSDQKSFIEAGVPAVQLFAGAHLDYHQPNDTADRIDPRGLVKIAALTHEALTYLAGRPDPLSSNLDGAAPPTVADPTKARSGRKVSLGTVPDFTYRGHGVRITGTTPGSPAASGGLAADDILIRVAGFAVDDLRSLSVALSKLEPGRSIEVQYERAGKVHRVQVIVVAR